MATGDKNVPQSLLKLLTDSQQAIRLRAFVNVKPVPHKYKQRKWSAGGRNAYTLFIL